MRYQNGDSLFTGHLLILQSAVYHWST